MKPTNDSFPRSWAQELTIAASLLVSFASFWALGWGIGADSDFLRGFAAGYGITAVLAFGGAVAFRLIRKRSAFGPSDERVRALSQKAGAITSVVTFFLLAVAVFFLSVPSLSALVGNDYLLARLCAIGLLGEMGLCFGVSYVILSIRS
jgi:hypothetical protein